MPLHLRPLLFVSAILLVTWSFAVPIFEAPDESWHWEYARFIHDNGGLPKYSPEMVEGVQAPLYYLLIAPVAAKTEHREMMARLEPGIFKLACPPKVFRDCPSDFRKFWSIRIARLVTVAFSLLTVLFTYLAGFETSGKRSTGLLAGCLVALLPEFTFRGSNISNDALVAAASAAATFLIIRLVRRGFSWKLGFLAALCVALAILSKVSAMVFVPVLAGALLIGPGSWINKGKRLGLLLVTALCAAPWLIRNQVLYGDLLASRAMLTALPTLVDKKSIFSSFFETTFPWMVADSFVGVFGWMSIYLPSWIYKTFALGGIISLVGMVFSVARRTIDRRLLVIFGAIVLLTFASLIQLNLTFTQPQGRLLFPALTALMVIAAIGFEALPPWDAFYTYGTILLLLTINLYSLFEVELPSYWTAQSHSTAISVDNSVILTPLTATIAGPLAPSGGFGQTFISHKPNLSAVEVFVATYEKRIPSGKVTLHLRSDPNATRDLERVTVNAASLSDNTFLRLTFPAIRDSKGKSFYLFLDARDLPPGYPLTVFVSRAADVYPGGQFYLNGTPSAHDMMFRTANATDSGLCSTCDQ